MSELQELKRLLVGEETDGLRRLRSRVEDRERRIQDISEALPDVIGSGDERLVAALQRPVNDCIRQSIEQDPQHFADILFPVMGPAIRAAISDAMRSLVRSINQTVESTMSVQGLKWRWESMRTGVPYGEIILRESFVYRVEQVFLVHRESGLLIDHAIAPEVAARDSDAVSGMLNAIQDFMRDSFAQGEGGNLREIEVGAHTLWIVHGPHAMLAAVIRGVAPVPLRDHMVSVLEKIHGDYASKLSKFQGDASELFGVNSQLESCLELELKQTPLQTENRRPSFISMLVKVLLAVIIVSLLVYFVWTKVDSENKRQAARRIIDDTPGRVVTDVFWDDNELHVVALSDPLSTVDNNKLKQAGIDADNIIYHLEPYQSLEAPIVSERSKLQLAVSATADTQLKDGILSVTGVVPYEWYRRTSTTPSNIVGVREINLDAVAIDPSSVKSFVRETLNAPESIAIDYDSGVVSLAGQAPQRWIDTAFTNLKTDKWIKTLDAKAVRPIELVSLRTGTHRLESTRLVVAQGDEDFAALHAEIAEVAGLMKSVLNDCRLLRRSCSIIVFGNVTGQDSTVEESRYLASKMVVALRSEGVPFGALRAEIGDDTYNAESTARQFVNFQVADAEL